MVVRLQGYLESNELNEPTQSAYKGFHSCQTTLCRVHNDILEIINRHYVMLLLLDLFAVFDTVDHDILLKRLDSRFSICGTALHGWFPSYLTNRTEFALIERRKITISRTKNVACLKALSLDPYCTYFIHHHWLTFCVIIRCNFILLLMIFTKQRPRISQHHWQNTGLLV